MSQQVSATSLAVGYRGQVVLEDFSVSIGRGDFWGIVGPNGSGKTTLIKTLAGVIPPLRGEVYRAPALSFGYVPQESNLDNIFPLTVFEVVVMGRYPRVGIGRRARKSDRDLAMHYMDQVGIADLAKCQFRQLSGGQKQRTLIVRALTFEADVLVFDEPARGMDLAGEAELMQLILELRRKFNRTVLMVTHDLNVIANYAEKLIILHGDEDGHFETGSVEELLTEAKISQIYRGDVRITSLNDRICVFFDETERNE